MVTTLAQPISSGAQRKQARSVTTPAFRLLGLQPREARLEVIRRAIGRAANEAHQQSLNKVPSTVAPQRSAADSERTVQIVTAAYRLLDPRRRPTLFERVQLILLNEEELEPSQRTFWDGIPPAPANKRRSGKRKRFASKRDSVPATAFVPEDSITEECSESEVALELFRSIRARGRRAKALWIGLIALTLSLTLALSLISALA